MPELGQVLWAASNWLISLAVIFLVMPFERYFPRLQNQKPVPGHFRKIFVFSLATFVLVLAIHFFLQDRLILYFLELRLVSISKLPLNATVLFVASFLFLDFLNYLRHVVAHHLTLFWRLHAVHHSDEHLTGVSNVLQHPIETLLSLVWLLFFSVILGIPLLAYIGYSVFVTIHGVVVHADIAVPRRIDRALRWLIVTPDVHRTHHSIQQREGNSNFGVVFTIWDRLFGTYLDQPATREALLVTGLPDSEKPRSFTVGALLLHPFVWRRQRKPATRS